MTATISDNKTIQQIQHVKSQILTACRDNLFKVLKDKVSTNRESIGDIGAIMVPDNDYYSKSSLENLKQIHQLLSFDWQNNFEELIVFLGKGRKPKPLPPDSRELYKLIRASSMRGYSNPKTKKKPDK